MKVLYAFQGTGNGHVARAQEIIPILKNYASVDTLISGHQSQLQLGFEMNHQYKGISLLYNKTGGISYKKILLQNNFVEALKIIRQIELNQYDLIINDYEPLTAWACKLRGLRMLELSHQAAMSFRETPRPPLKNKLGAYILSHYAPSQNKIGFHFDSYHSQIKTPVIRKKIRNLSPRKMGYYVVYLPGFSDEILSETLQKIPVEWKVFSKYCKKQIRLKNVEFFPIDEQKYLKCFQDCDGILCSAGFEGPAEALLLGKKLFVIPIRNQYEQECNAFALQNMGIGTSHTLDENKISDWVASDHYLHIDYPDDIEEILLKDVLTFK